MSEHIIIISILSYTAHLNINEEEWNVSYLVISRFLFLASKLNDTVPIPWYRLGYLLTGSIPMCFRVASGWLWTRLWFIACRFDDSLFLSLLPRSPVSPWGTFAKKLIPRCWSLTISQVYSFREGISGNSFVSAAPFVNDEISLIRR